MGIWGWCVAYLVRWLPHGVPAGLEPIGTPGPDSPVIVTANYSLTVARVRRALRGHDVWLLIVPTKGINVWCSAAAGIFNHHRVIDAVKVADLANLLTHRRLILPALSAPGIDRQAIRDATGFTAEFGPVYAADLGQYLRSGGEKTEAMKRFRFDWRHRLEMLVPMNLPLYLILALILALAAPALLLRFTVLFWLAALLLYGLTPWIPGRSGWTQSLVAGCLSVALWIVWNTSVHGTPFFQWGWYVGTLGLFAVVGFDLAGIATPRKSDAEVWLHRMGLKSLPPLFSPKDLGTITLDRQRCEGCSACRDICPVGVFGQPDAEGKTTLPDPSACFNCGACVRQCPRRALSLVA